MVGAAVLSGVGSELPLTRRLISRRSPRILKLRVLGYCVQPVVTRSSQLRSLAERLGSKTRVWKPRSRHPPIRPLPTQIEAPLGMTVGNGKENHEGDLLQKAAEEYVPTLESIPAVI